MARFASLALLAFALGAQAPSPPGAPLVSSGSIVILVNGQPVSAGGVINLVSGANTVAIAKPNPAIGGTDIEYDANSATLLTKTADQSGANRYCNSVAMTTAYSCTLSASQKLTALTLGTTILLTVDTTTQAGITGTLVVDSIGQPAPIDENDGVTPAVISKGVPYLLFWDGKVWRVIE